jgi:cell division protease FtsH
MIAKATACEAGVNFIQAAGSEFIEMYVGVGAKRVREIFQQARQSSPCILFIDEVECIGIKRSSSYERPNAEQLSTLDQLLNEMDGFLGSENVVVLAATNKYTMLDDALLRPGRFDRKIKIGLPDSQTRFDILQLSLASKSHTIT